MAAARSVIVDWGAPGPTVTVAVPALTSGTAPKSRSEPESTVLFPLTVQGFPVQRSPGTVAPALRAPRIARARAAVVVSNRFEFDTNLLRNLAEYNFMGGVRRSDRRRGSAQPRSPDFCPEGVGIVSRENFQASLSRRFESRQYAKRASSARAKTSDRGGRWRRVATKLCETMRGLRETMRRCDIRAVTSRR